MNDYLFLMHDDATATQAEGAWPRYLASLRASGVFEGGSSVGAGASFRRDGAPRPITPHLGGYLRIRAESLEEARRFLAGNPVFEAGGTVEIRELPRDG